MIHIASYKMQKYCKKCIVQLREIELIFRDNRKCQIDGMSVGIVSIIYNYSETIKSISLKDIAAEQVMSIILYVYNR